MKKIYRYILILSFIMIASTVSHAQDQKQDKLLRHVVMFKFKDSSSRADVKRVEDAYAGLTQKNSLIKDFEWGTNNSPENLNQGHTHCFFVTVTSEKERDAYLIHPDHKAFVDVL